MLDPTSQELLDLARKGNADAAAAIFDRYVERLLALARTRMSSKLRRRVDPDDIVQSAYRSFFVHAENGEYQLNRSGDLWRLLAGITANKLYGQIEKHTAGKRHVGREIADATALAKLASHDPTIVDVVAVGEQLNMILDSLSRDERFVLLSTLQEQSLANIVETMNKSERTVRRLLAQAKRKFELRLLDEPLPKRTATSTASSDDSEPSAPLRFSDYTLKELLGSGGMGKIYRATDNRAGKTVAFKALHKSRQRDQRAVDRFVQESLVLAKLDHPNIVGVEGLGRFPAGGYFIVMDFVDGSDLQRRLKSGPIPLGEAIPIVRDVAIAVQHAHERGIVHCDLKPANVLMDAGDQVFVTDFGFAHILEHQPAGGAGNIGGTAGYLPPELLSLDQLPTPAADIFAIGALLWTLVTGRVPDGLQDVTAKPTLPDQVEYVCRRCLAPRPADRFASAAGLVGALEAVPLT